jgi:hypothetical protein
LQPVTRDDVICLAPDRSLAKGHNPQGLQPCLAYNDGNPQPQTRNLSPANGWFLLAQYEKYLINSDLATRNKGRRHLLSV